MTDMDKLIAQDADLIDPIQDRLVLAVRSLATDDTQGVAEAFAEALRKGLAAQGLAVAKADRIEALNAEVARLKALLDERDKFIVSRDLWGAFTDTLGDEA